MEGELEELQPRISELTETISCAISNDAETEDFQKLLASAPPELLDKGDHAGVGTVLQFAVMLGREQHVRLLLQHGVDPTANTATSTNYHNRLPPLRIAIKFGFMQIWKMIRDQMELTEEAKLDQLYFMLEERQIESPTVPPFKEFKELLLSLPMELVSRTPFLGKWSLLDVAVYCNQIETVRLLLDHGFDVKAGVAREESRSPQRVLFDVATANPMMVDEMLDVLFETIANELSDDVKLVWLFRLAHRGWEDKEKFRSLLHKVSLDLVNKTCDPLTSDPANGNLFQTTLIKGGHENFVRLLLEYGADPDFTPNDLNPGTPCQIATYKAADSMKTKDLKILNLFAEATDMKMENKLKYMKLVVQQGWKEWISFEGFKKQLSTMSAAELDEVTVPEQWAMDWTEMKYLQFLACDNTPVKMEVLRILLDHGLDPLAVSKDLPLSAVEIAAAKGNTKAFDLLAAYTQESNMKKICQLWIWAWFEKLPSDKFKNLLQSIPIEEVNRQSIKGTGDYREQGRNLLQFLALEGKTAHVSLLLQQGADPEAVTDENPDIPLRCAWLNDHVATMGVLAELSEVSLEIRSSSSWQLVEKEQEKRWQKEVLEKLNKQAELLTLVAKAVGVKIEGDQ